MLTGGVPKVAALAGSQAARADAVFTTPCARRLTPARPVIPRRARTEPYTFPFSDFTYF